MANQYYSSVISGVAVENHQGPYQSLRIRAVGVVDAHAARRVSDGLEALIITVDSKAAVGVKQWPASVGFEVTSSPETPGSPSSRLQVFLQLTESRYRDVFLALCEDICCKLIAANDEENAVRGFHSRLMKWQSFFKKGRLEGLSEEYQVGLFGELHIMIELLLPVCRQKRVLQAWRGCKRANQDFQFADWALEVKTSRATIIEKITISNVQQLDEDDKAPLVLTVVHVHSNRTHGATLPEIVERLREQLEGDASDLFEQGLFEVGYLDIHAFRYKDTKYQVIEVSHFEVRDGFPRLRRSDLPDGVKGVKYEISIDAARGFKVGEGIIHETAKESDDAGQD